jgi:tetratricopeptide (TPR) repeat protein
MLSEADPANRPAGTDFTVADALETAAHMVDSGDRSPRLEAEVRRVVGVTFYSLGRYEEAELQMRTALETLQKLDPVPAAEAARLKIQLGAVLVDSGKVDEAERILEAARDVLAEAGPEHAVSWAAATNSLADVARVRGDHQTAKELNEIALTAVRSIDGEPADTIEASLLIDLGSMDLELMEVESAEKRIREGLALQRTVFGDGHPTIARTQLKLAKVLAEKGEFDTADQLFRASLETTREVFGHDHIRVAVVLHNYGFHLRNRSPERAEAYLREAVEVLKGRGNDVAVARALDVLAAVQMDLEEYRQAEANFQRSLQLRRVALPDGHPDIAQSLNNLGSLYMRSKRYDRAVPMLEQALDRYRRILGDRHPQVVVVIYNLGSTLSDAGKLDRALAQLQTAWQLATEVFPEGHLNTAVIQAKYGECLGRLARFEKAETLLIPAFESITSQLGEHHWRSLQTARMIEELHSAQGKPSRDQ